MTRRHVNAIPFTCAKIARYLRVSTSSVQHQVARMVTEHRPRAVAFQTYRFVLFQRQTRPRGAKNPRPEWKLINRDGLDRIGGEAGRTRARLRQKQAQSWYRYIEALKNLAWSQLIRGYGTGDSKHKGSHDWKTGGGRAARPPPPRNRAALRRFKDIAFEIGAVYATIPDAPIARIHSWAMHRCSEGHSFARVCRFLRHAVKVLNRKASQPQPWTPPNPVAWTLAVAGRHLNGDGLVPVIRNRIKPERQPAARATFKVMGDSRTELEIAWKKEYDRVMSKRIKPSWETE